MSTGLIMSASCDRNSLQIRLDLGLGLDMIRVCRHLACLVEDECEV